MWKKWFNICKIFTSLYSLNGSKLAWIVTTNQRSASLPFRGSRPIKSRGVLDLTIGMLLAKRGRNKWMFKKNGYRLVILLMKKMKEFHRNKIKCSILLCNLVLALDFNIWKPWGLYITLLFVNWHLNDGETKAKTDNIYQAFKTANEYKWLAINFNWDVHNPQVCYWMDFVLYIWACGVNSNK